MWTVDEISEMILSNDVAVEKAIVRLYNLSAFRKDPSEKGWGFSRFDYSINKSFCRYYDIIMNANWTLSPGERLRTRIGPESFEKTRKRLLKYAQQLTKISNGSNVPELVEGVRDYDDPPNARADRLVPYESDMS